MLTRMVPAMLKVFSLLLVLALLFSQFANLHYHAHHHASEGVAGHALQHSLHPAATIHADIDVHESVSTVEAIGELALKSSAGFDLPIILVAILLFAWLLRDRANALRPQPAWIPKPAFAHLRPPLRAPPL